MATALAGLRPVTDHLLGSVGGSLAGALGARGAAEGGAPGVVDTLGGATATAWTVGYVVAFVGMSMLLVRRRDLL